MKIQFKHIGTHLGGRFHGAEVRQDILAILEKGEEKVVFDLEGVQSMSNSFADECFAKLTLFYSMDEVKQRTTFKNANSFIRSVIAVAIKGRLKIMTGA